MAAPSSSPTPDPTLFWSFPSFSSPLNGSTENLTRMGQVVTDCINNAEWIAVEKIHGSNFSVTFHPNEITPRYGSRNMYLEGEKLFFNHIKVLEPYMSGIIELTKYLRSGVDGMTYPADARVQLFGEIFGGVYPDPSIPNDRPLGGVQKVNTVYYCPHTDFIAFDLYINYQPINRDRMFELFKKYNIRHLTPRFRGKCSELLAHSPVFESELYKQYTDLKLATIPNNKAEGMVLQPVEPLTIFSDDEQKRIMFKHKNPAHFETGPASKPVKPVKQQVNKDLPPLESLPAATSALIEKSMQYVTLNRFGNLLSKIGEYDPEARTRLIGALVQDAIVDLQKEISEEEKTTLQKQQKFIRGYMAVQGGNVVDEYVQTTTKKQ